ncbi:MAG: helix-turn-helix transcriptional regulator [Bacteroidales bacterium]|nr:helix-turn-helix transcriptional regulator [Bacteroidales bacterium]MDD3201471.1 helix-turn-helix transcriptional regulator [Bacteroidales bacterium]
MNTTEQLFKQCVSGIPDKDKKQMGLSFDVADKIDSILKKKNMTQKDFAAKMGKDEAEVSRWLGGTHNFTIRTLASISYVLGEDIIRVR